MFSRVKESREMNFVLAVASMRINATIIPFTILFDGSNKKNF
jgi:hypothetical protein